MDENESRNAEGNDGHGDQSEEYFGRTARNKKGPRSRELLGPCFGLLDGPLLAVSSDPRRSAAR